MHQIEAIKLQRKQQEGLAATYKSLDAVRGALHFTSAALDAVEFSCIDQGPPGELAARLKLLQDAPRRLHTGLAVACHR